MWKYTVEPKPDCGLKPMETPAVHTLSQTFLRRKYSCSWLFTAFSFEDVKYLSLFLSLCVVKYIKEMSAFFKGGSTSGPPVLDSPPATPQKQADPALKETRTIPLAMCHVTRKHCPPDTEDR